MRPRSAPKVKVFNAVPWPAPDQGATPQCLLEAPLEGRSHPQRVQERPPNATMADYASATADHTSPPAHRASLIAEHASPTVEREAADGHDATAVARWEGSFAHPVIRPPHDLPAADWRLQPAAEVEHGQWRAKSSESARMIFQDRAEAEVARPRTSSCIGIADGMCRTGPCRAGALR